MKIKLIAKNLCFFAAFLLLFYVESLLNIVAFSVAFFVALVYCKQNVIVLSPLYVIAGVLLSPTINAIIITVTPIFAIVIALFVHYKLHKTFSMITAGICTVVGVLPSLILLLSDNIFSVILSLICSQVSLYCFTVVQFAVLKKKLRFKLNKEEILSFCYTFAVCGMGFAAINIVGYSIFNFVLSGLLLAMLFVNQKMVLPVALAFGLGGAVGCSDISYIAVSLLYGGVVTVFDSDNHYIAGAMILAVHLGYILIFEEVIDFFTLIAPAVGVLIVLIIPKKYKHRLVRFTPCFAEAELPRTLVNRDRKHIADKLDKLSQVFYEMSDILHMEVSDSTIEHEREMIKSETVHKYCGLCPNYIVCQSELGCVDTSIMFDEVVDAALASGRATLLDTPPILTSRCVRVGGLINYINDIAEEYKYTLQHKANVDEGRAMVSDQMSGVGLLLDRLKGEVETNIVFNKDMEQELKDKLAAVNIAVNDAVILSSATGEHITLIISERDIVNHKLQVTINAVMGHHMEILSKESMPNGLCVVHLERAAKYKVIYGASQRSHFVGETNGDNHNAVKIDNTRVMLVLADGMGAGKGASQDSGYCVSMLESFYKAGFDHTTIAQNVGRLLAIRAKESFNAVDIAVIDTYNGYIDLVKLGGRESFIINNNIVEVVECGSLPLGIISNVEPLIKRIQVKNNSTLVMVSDGIVDYIGRTELIDLLATSCTTNTEKLADIIIEAVIAINGGKMEDDASVLVARLVMCA